MDGESVLHQYTCTYTPNNSNYTITDNDSRRTLLSILLILDTRIAIMTEMANRLTIELDSVETWTYDPRPNHADQTRRILDTDRSTTMFDDMWV